MIESNEPTFLRRLKAEYAGGDSARHERPLARPRKQLKDGEDDDQPIYVVEGSEDILSKAEYEALMEHTNDKERDENGCASSPQPHIEAGKLVEGSNEVSEDIAPAKQKSAAIGGSNKRRIAKVIGEDDNDGGPNQGKKTSVPPTKKSKAKKGKKVKLCFDEEAPEP